MSESCENETSEAAQLHTRSSNFCDQRTMRERMTDLMEFDGHDIALRRGVPLDVVLAKAGSLFAEAAGSSATYMLSRPAKALYVFISHNWVTPRWKKYWTLLVFFNVRFALGVALVFSTAVSVATALGLLPTVLDRAYDLPMGLCGRCLIIPVFLLALVLRSELAAWFPLQGPLVFLDKVCINQTNPEQMSRGIHKLGAFLQASGSMVVVFTDIYTTKLWTIFEVACFIVSHPIDDLVILPVQNAIVFFWIICVIIPVYNAVFIVMRSMLDITFVMVFLMAGGLYGYSLASRSWARARLAAAKKLASFSVRSCTCAVEADRPVVYSNITVLMVAKGLVREGSSEDEALDKFDQLVRSRLPKAFDDAFGAANFSRAQYGIICLSVTGIGIVDGMCWIADLPLQAALASALDYTASGMILQPVALLAFERLAYVRMQWAGLREHAFVILAVLLVGSINFVLMGLSTRLAQAAEESVAALVAQIALVTVAALSWVAPRRWLCRRSAAGEAGGASEDVVVEKVVADEGEPCAAANEPPGAAGPHPAAEDEAPAPGTEPDAKGLAGHAVRGGEGGEGGEGEAGEAGRGGTAAPPSFTFCGDLISSHV